MLEIRKLRKSFGGVIAVKDVSLNVERGKIVCLIGPNGAGKTTLFKLITRELEADSGEIYFKGIRVNDLSPYEVARLGIGRVFQIPLLWDDLSVLQNLCVPRVWRKESLTQIKERAHEILTFLNLTHLKDEPARNLSGGQRRLLEIGRVMMLDPDLFLLDEPFVGLHPIIKKQILDCILSLNKMGKTFIVTSHDMSSVAYLCEKGCNDVVVMSAGEIIARGELQEIRNNTKVIQAYLGE
ncbi:MAG: ABC transporter ATP-binding protein [Candidatus Bathyarchaeia archaeon]